MACLATDFGGDRVVVAEDRMVVVRREDAKFVPLSPSQPDGTQVAVLWGDPAIGPSTMIMRMRKTAGRLHYHTFGYDLVLLEGQMKHWGEREQEAETPPLGPGSYWHQPGLLPHGDSCLTDECLMFIKWEGKRDAMLASPPK
jgi:hypothetical protein